MRSVVVLTRAAEILSTQPMSSEILWNFSRYTDDRRIALQQNPHFYLDLPTTKDAYGAGFFKDSTKEFKFKGNDTVYVLVDKPDLSRVYLEAEKRKRIFGNVWRPNDVMIFKGEPNITRSKFASPHIWQIFVGG